MIYSILILYFAFSIRCTQAHPFYVLDVSTIEQCPTGSHIYLKTFELDKMRCLDKTWRRVVVSMDYSCTGNNLKRTWKIATKENSKTDGPKSIHISSITNGIAKQSLANINGQEQNPTVDDSFQPYDPKHTKKTIVAYMWTLPHGPQCRIKYSIENQNCTGKKAQKTAAKLFEFVCYYGSKQLNLVTETKQFDQLLDSMMNANQTQGNLPSNKTNNLSPNNSNNLSPNNSNNLSPNKGNSSSSSQNSTALLQNPAVTGNGSQQGSISSQTEVKKSNKLIYIGAGLGGVLVLLAIAVGAFYFYRRRASTTENVEERFSLGSSTVT